MIKRRKKFRGHVFLLQSSAIFMLLLTICSAILAIYLIHVGIKLPALPSSALVSGIERTILSMKSPQINELSLSPYDLIANSLLSIRSSDVMSKKYAAKYGGVIKKTEISSKTNISSSQNEKIQEIDVSAKGITFINTPGYAVDAQSLLTAPLAFTTVSQEPKVLIVHTHTSEAYAESEDSRNTNNQFNVVCVGTEIAQELKKAGINTVHDITQNDNPSYNQSYKKALTVIESNLAKYPSIEVVLDIHRDYIKRDDGTLVKPTIKTKSGKKAAQIMFVIGTDNMGLYHPDWQHNLSFSVKIQDKLNQIQPGLCRSINIRTERFNQHITKGSMIIEVGTGVNTTEEAKYSGKLIGQAVAAVLKNH